MFGHKTHQIFALWGMFFALILVASSVKSEPYPPLWSNGSGAAIHYSPVQWPAEPPDPADCGDDCGEWKPYTRFQNGLADPRTKDPSNGGTSPQSYVNVASSCIDKSLPSIYYALHRGNTEAEDVLMFRWRVESSAHTYATGKNAGAYGASNPWSSALWTVFFDLDGSGYRSLAAHLDGSIGSPAEAIDRISGIWGDSRSHSLDYDNDDNVHLLGHNPTAFIGDNNKILNFADNLTPTEDWLNGADETSWDYGTSRAKLVSKNSCTEYFIDYQIPIKMLDASAKTDSSGVAGPSITRDTPISMLFCSANSLNNPLQKDCAIGKEWLANPAVTAPFGDYLSFNQDKPYSQPIISSIDVVAPNTCPGTYQINATVQDTLALQNGVVVPSVKSVDFYYWYDVNGDGAASSADTDSEWVKIGSPGALDPGTLNSWSATWDATILPKGQFLIGVQAVDDNTKIDDGMVASGVDNRTVSYLAGDDANEIYISGSWATGQQALFLDHSPALTPSASEDWYGNPAVTGEQVAVLGTAINACGLAPAISLVANASSVSAEETVGYSITVSNPLNNSAVIVSSISDVLPDGFSYDTGSTTAEITDQADTTTGVTIDDPSQSGQTFTWTFASPISLDAGETLTLNFNAIATSISGTYNNNAYAVTSLDDLESGPVAIAVDAARLSLAIIPDSFSVAADGIDEITFTISYANDATVPVTNAIITSSINSELGYISCAGGTSCALSGNDISWDLGDIAGGATGSVSYTITVANTWASRSLTSSATLGAIAPDASAVSVTEATTVAVTGVSIPGIPSLSLSNTSNVVSVAPGGNVTYTLGYFNDGNETATGITLTDTIPAGMTFSSCTGGCAESDGVITWSSLSDLAQDTLGSVTLTVSVAADNPFTFSNPTNNTATVNWDNGSPVMASAQVGVSGGYCDAVFYFNPSVNGLVKTASEVAPTGSTTSLISIDNITDANFEAYNLESNQIIFESEAFANGLNISGSTLRVDFYLGAFTGGMNTRVILRNVTQNIEIATSDPESISNGENWVSYTFNGLNPAITQIDAGDKLRWYFQLAAKSGKKDAIFHYDSVTANSRSSFCGGTAPADLTLSTSVSDTSITAGDTATPTLTYTQNYANIGQADADSTQLVAGLPAGFTNCQYSADNSTWGTCSASESHTFAFGTLIAGHSGTVYIRGDAPSSTIDDSKLTANSTISSDQTADVTATAETSVVEDGGSGVAELSLSLTADKSSLVPGDVITYTLTATNIGGTDATNVVITNTLPIADYFQYSACSDSCVPPDIVNGNEVSWSIGNLIAGNSQSVNYSMLVNTTNLAAGITLITDDGSASGTVLSAVTSNQVAVAITGNPLLDISVSATPNSGLSPNDEFGYEIKVENKGSATATSVNVVTPLPAYTHFVSLDAPPVGSANFDTIGNKVVHSLGDLGSAVKVTLNFRARVSNNLASGNTTTTFTSTISAGNALNKSASVPISADATPVLTLTKTQSGTTAYPAATLTAAISNSTTLYVDKSSDFSLNQLVQVNGVVARIKNISTNSIELDGAVSASIGEYVIGSITLTMTYQNTGNATATNVSLTDVLATELTYSSSAPVADSAPTVGTSGSVSWNVGLLAPGEFASKSVVAFPYGSQGSFISTATVDANNATAVDASVTTLIGGLSVAKTTSTKYVANGAVATYQITLSNTLATDISNVSVTDLLASDFLYKSGSATVNDVATEPTFAIIGTETDTTQPIWAGLTVTANSSVNIDFSVDVSANAGAATYQNELNVTVPANTGLQSFNPLTTTAEDVTVLRDDSGVIGGYVFSRDNTSITPFDPNQDVALANVQVNVHADGDTCINLYSSTCYVAYTNNDGYFEAVLPIGDWYIDVQTDTGGLNTDEPDDVWTQTVGTADGLVSVSAGNLAQADSGFRLNVVNQAPTITSIAPLTATEGSEYAYTATVTDVDDDNNGTDLTWSLTNAPAGMTVTST
ncbi:beta strand repeat-containing protein, partial [Thalassotalea sp. ND16A]|uniref:beta strand repeat-containing protein n=1 Tax=Thalassotalea sp. ND16A TaxID=1535422 RepID=UPI00051D9AF9